MVAKFIQFTMAQSRKDVREILEARRIRIATTPINVIGPMRKLIFRLVMRITGSQLTWAMHWAIEIEDTYFELQRVQESPKPTLSVSRWASDRKKDIVTDAFAGTTTRRWSYGDVEVVAVSIRIMVRR